MPDLYQVLVKFSKRDMVLRYTDFTFPWGRHFQANNLCNVVNDPKGDVNDALGVSKQKDFP